MENLSPPNAQDHAYVDKIATMVVDWISSSQTDSFKLSDVKVKFATISNMWLEMACVKLVNEFVLVSSGGRVITYEVDRTKLPVTVAPQKIVEKAKKPALSISAVASSSSGDNKPEAIATKKTSLPSVTVYRPPTSVEVAVPPAQVAALVVARPSPLAVALPERKQKSSCYAALMSHIASLSRESGGTQELDLHLVTSMGGGACSASFTQEDVINALKELEADNRVMIDDYNALVYLI